MGVAVQVSVFLANYDGDVKTENSRPGSWRRKYYDRTTTGNQKE